MINKPIFEDIRPELYQNKEGASNAGRESRRVMSIRSYRRKMSL